MTNQIVSILVTIAMVVGGCAAPDRPQSAPARPTEPMMTPGSVFDDFVGPSGSLPDTALWDYDIGPYQDAGLQTYTNSPDDVHLDGEGHLVIQARTTATGYTSARPVTRGKLSMLYGTVSARIKFPSGQGIWPAFWMLGSDMSEVGWPRCGEIDLMEIVNTGTEYHVTLHGPQGDSDYYGGVAKSGQVVGTSGPIADLTNDFHTYWMNWQPDRITIGIDDATHGTFTPSSLPPGAQWVFDHPMYALLNIAIGGDWAGPPDASTPWPATMLVDWFHYVPGQ